VGAFGAMAEYTESQQDVSRVVATGTRRGTVDSDAWQFAVSYFLTGEEASFKGFQPKTRFSPGEGTWGAFEVKARVQEINVSDDAFAGGADSFADPLAAARSAQSYGIGLNWYLNENLKWVFDVERTSFEGGALTGDRPDEDSYQLRLAVAF
jgi:phosphate-selective porin OprO/OprP